MSVLFFVALAIVFGFILGKLVGFIKLPGVVGYLLAGLILGSSFLNVFDDQMLDKLSIFNSFALSLIAFMIGSEMKLSTFKEMGAGIGVITVLESLGAFIIVTLGVYFLTGKLYLALVFGAMAPASAPAGTVAVLQECKAKGRLTKAIYAVVGLDDGLAIILFALAISLAKILLVGESISAMTFVKGPVLEITGSIILGGVVGVITGFFARKIRSDESMLAISLGGILICSGIAEYFHFSLILANLSLGMVFVNLYSISNRKAHRVIRSLSLPVYIIFFFMAGASLHIKLLPSMGLIGLIYIVCRATGLIGGAFIGALLSRQVAVIRKYLGFGILSQAGVAIGLSVLAAGEFRTLGQAGENLAIIVVNTIAASTIIFEIIGPIGTKFAITRAGEIGLNITEEDLIETYNVSDVMDSKVPIVTAGMSLSEVIKVVSSTDNLYYSVIDAEEKLIGAVTLDGIRNTFATQELNDWLVALDILEPVEATVLADMPLSEALERTKSLDTEHLPVVAAGVEDKYVGVLDCRAVRRQLSAEVLSRQQKADNIAR